MLLVKKQCDMRALRVHSDRFSKNLLTCSRTLTYMHFAIGHMFMYKRFTTKGELYRDCCVLNRA